jgi:uncharacterized protein
MSGEVIHFEVPAANVERARKFYSSAFGWKMTVTMGEDYTLVGTTPTGRNGRPKAPGAINGGLLKRQSFVRSPVITIGVPDINAALRKIKRLKGKVLQAKAPVGDFGFAAYFRDPEGNVMGLFQARS